MKDKLYGNELVIAQIMEKFNVNRENAIKLFMYDPNAPQNKRMTVKFQVYLSNHYTSIDEYTYVELSISTPKKEIDELYSKWVLDVAGNGWFIYGVEDDIHPEQYEQLSMEEKYLLISS